jgi:hypothetical protein
MPLPYLQTFADLFRIVSELVHHRLLVDMAGLEDRLTQPHQGRTPERPWCVRCPDGARRGLRVLIQMVFDANYRVYGARKMWRELRGTGL